MFLENLREQHFVRIVQHTLQHLQEETTLEFLLNPRLKLISV